MSLTKNRLGGKFRLAAMAGLCAALSLMPAPAIAAQGADTGPVQLGRMAWDDGRHLEAVRYWRLPARAGDAYANFNMGQAYRMGRGAPKDIARAIDHFERAAFAGHLAARTTLGLVLYREGSKSRGLSWLELASLNGDPRAMLVYGTALFNGDGIERNPVRGYAWVLKAVDEGLGDARKTQASMQANLTAPERREALSVARGLSLSPPPAPRPVSLAEIAELRAAEEAKIAAAAKPSPPVDKPATTPAPMASQAAGPWRVQLGAFRTKGAAKSLADRLAASGPLKDKQAYIERQSGLDRLRMGPFATRSDAQRACSALGAGQACLVVRD